MPVRNENSVYYVEDIINGVLMYKTEPNGAWKQCSIEKMSKRINKMKKEIAILITQCDNCKYYQVKKLNKTI